MHAACSGKSVLLFTFMVDRSSAKVLSDLEGIGLISATRIHASMCGKAVRMLEKRTHFSRCTSCKLYAFWKLFSSILFCCRRRHHHRRYHPPSPLVCFMHIFLTSFTKIISPKKAAEKCRKTNISCLPAKLFIFHINWCTHFDTLHAYGCREHLNATEKKNVFYVAYALAR